LCAGDKPAVGAVHTGGLAAGMLSLRFDPVFTAKHIDTFCNALQLFKLGFSWGGPMSLVVPYELSSLRSMAAPDTLQGGFVRLSVGLEAVEDLIADLAQALKSASM